VFAVGFVGDRDEVGAQEDVTQEGVQVEAEAADLFGTFLG